MRLLIARARSLGWSKLIVKGVYTHNDRSRRLYERAGFRLMGFVYDDGGPLAWRFELPLS